MTNTKKQLTTLEAQHPAASQADADAYTHHQRRSAELSAFVKAAFPESRDCVAGHLAHILGLPDAPAFRALLRGQPRDPDGGVCRCWVLSD
jgi:hypothetical protein